jgi:hypothetical protein
MSMYDRNVSELVRERAQEMRTFLDTRVAPLMMRLTVTRLLAGLCAVALVYGIAFIHQSRSAERFCLRERHASAFYVSPWSLTRYCTRRAYGTELTFEAGEP